MNVFHFISSFHEVVRKYVNLKYVEVLLKVVMFPRLFVLGGNLRLLPIVHEEEICSKCHSPACCRHLLSQITLNRKTLRLLPQPELNLRITLRYLLKRQFFHVCNLAPNHMTNPFRTLACDMEQSSCTFCKTALERILQLKNNTWLRVLLTLF